MEQVVWSVEERFVFPSIGTAHEVEAVKVTPQWQVEDELSSVRLVGVYHIAANLKFQSDTPHIVADDSVAVEEIDFDGTTGYFEYAVPFEVDLPKDIDAPTLAVQDVTTKFHEGRAVICWDVSCHYHPLVAVTEEVLENHVNERVHNHFQEIEEVEEKQFVEVPPHSVASAPLIWDLKDNYTVMEVRLNPVISQ